MAGCVQSEAERVRAPHRGAALASCKCSRQPETWGSCAIFSTTPRVFAAPPSSLNLPSDNGLTAAFNSHMLNGNDLPPAGFELLKCERALLGSRYQASH